MHKTPFYFTVFLTFLLALGLSACSKSGPAVVSTANPHASKAAAEILEIGGSAMDAAIAAQMVLGLVEPQSSGIGGGAFALYWHGEEKSITSFDGREKAPGNVDETLFLDDQGQPLKWHDASIGGRAVGVPGVIAMLWKAHQKFGQLPWEELFDPAITLAEQGFEVTPRLAGALTRSQKDLQRNDLARQLYFTSKGTEPLVVGMLFKNLEYAKTLKIIAQKGPEGFYTGPIAQAIVDAVQNHRDNSGQMTMKDLKAYEAIERQVVCSSYRSYKVCGMPPPTSGGLTSQMILGLLEPFDIGALAPGSPMAMHLFTQASRLAYADRNIYMADADFIDVPVKGLLNKNYLKQRARLISPLSDMGLAAPGSPPEADQAALKAAGHKTPEYGTSHLSIVDDNGNAISMTTSVERSFGAHIMANGFVLNNQLTDFSFAPKRGGVAVANRVEANKRPRSSMSPTLVFGPDGKLFATVGSPGGSRIIEFVSRTLIGLIDWQLPMQQAIDLGNVNNRNRVTELEEGTPVAGFAKQFTKMGHKVKVGQITSGLHGVRITADGMDGGADPRREGLVIELGR